MEDQGLVRQKAPAPDMEKTLQEGTEGKCHENFWSNASARGLVSCNMKMNVGQAYYSYYFL